MEANQRIENSLKGFRRKLLHHAFLGDLLLAASCAGMWGLLLGLTETFLPEPVPHPLDCGRRIVPGYRLLCPASVCDAHGNFVTWVASPFWWRATHRAPGQPDCRGLGMGNADARPESCHRRLFRRPGDRDPGRGDPGTGRHLECRSRGLGQLEGAIPNSCLGGADLWRSLDGQQ